MAERKRTRTYSEAAAEVNELKDSGDELAGLEAVPASINPQPRAVVSLRLSPEELRRFTDAARDRGMSFSDFMRASASAAADGTIDIEKSAALTEVREKVDELSQALKRLRVS